MDVTVNGVCMLTDSKLRGLKAREKPYKVVDRDGLYVTVSKAGTVVFRYDYRLNGRRETLSIGRFGADGICGVDPLPFRHHGCFLHGQQNKCHWKKYQLHQ